MASVVEETVEPVVSGVHAGGGQSMAEHLLASGIDDKTMAALAGQASGSGVGLMGEGTPANRRRQDGDHGGGAGADRGPPRPAGQLRPRIVRKRQRVIQALQHSPHGSNVTEGQMTGPLRNHRLLARIQQRLDLRYRTHIAL